MQIKLGALLAASPALRKLVSADLPVSLAFGLSKSLKAIDGELTAHEEQRQALVKKYGEADDAGNFTVSPDRYEAFFAGLSELNGLEVEVPFTPISVSRLGDDVRLSAVDLSALVEAGFITE